MARTLKTEREGQVADKPATNNYFRTGSAGRGWLYGLGAAIIILAVFFVGVCAANHRHRVGVFEPGNMVREAGGGFMLGRHGMSGAEFGNNATIDGQTRISGVVTAVNGNNFTVAGHGSTTNVITNSSTQYQNGSSQLKQNDSVLVIGTDSNGTITASQIVINP